MNGTQRKKAPKAYRAIFHNVGVSTTRHPRCSGLFAITTKVAYLFNSIRLFYEYNYNILPRSYQGSKRGYRHHARKYFTFSHRTGNQCPLSSYSDPLRPAHRRSHILTTWNHSPSRQQSTQSLRSTSSYKLGTSPILRSAFTPLSTLIQHPQKGPFSTLFCCLHKTTRKYTFVCLRVFSCVSMFFAQKQPQNKTSLSKIFPIFATKIKL